MGKNGMYFFILYPKKPFPSKESDTKILQSIYFAYWVGIIRSYSNQLFFTLHSYAP